MNPLIDVRVERPLDAASVREINDRAFGSPVES